MLFILFFIELLDMNECLKGKGYFYGFDLINEFGFRLHFGGGDVLITLPI